MGRARVIGSIAVTFVTCVVAAPRHAFAADAGDDGAPSPADRSAPRVAQALFDDGRSLMEAGRFAEACPKLAESQRLDPGGGTLLNLALCYERLGATATAWATYNAALSAALADRRGEREAFARGRIAELAPRVPRLRIELGTNARGGPVEVRIDDDVVPRAALDTTTPVDPGRHTVRASAPGRAPWTITVSVAERATETIWVPDLPPAFLTMAPPDVVGRARGAGFWIFGGASALSLGTSVVTGILALSAHATADGKCLPERSYCPDPTSADDAARARTLAWVSTGTLAGGAAFAVAALLWPRPKGSASASASRWTVAVAPAPSGASFGVRVALP